MNELSKISANAHVRKLRSQFVSHKGKKELAVSAMGNRYTINFGDMAVQMTQQLHDNVTLCPNSTPQKTNVIFACSHRS
jgi:tripartite-type tricarboxylate transporter receptor subunit TctC